MMRRLRLRGLVVLVAATALFAFPFTPAASAACGLLGLFPCVTPPTPAPDPGGSESDQPVPPPNGKVLGFNSALFHSLLPAAVEADTGRRAGASFQRYGVAWRYLQTSPNLPPLGPDTGRPLGSARAGGELAQADAIYLELTGRRMTPVIMLGEAPPWAAGYGNCFWLDLICKAYAGLRRLVPNGAHLGDWQRYAAAVATRYPKAVVETWNEPNVSPFWLPFRPNPVHMAQMQCRAYAAAKASPGRNTVLSPGFAVFTSPRSDGSPLFKDYLAALYRTSAGGCWDGFSAHVYTGGQTTLGAGSAFAKIMYAIRAGRAWAGDTSPIWVTETGSKSAAGAASEAGALTEAGQASLNRRLYNRFATMSDIHAIGFHSLRNAPTVELLGRTGVPDYHFGFLRENLHPKPIFCWFVAQSGSRYTGC
jgi:hypothetical protein